jgi:hypothetical protein
VLLLQGQLGFNDFLDLFRKHLLEANEVLDYIRLRASDAAEPSAREPSLIEVRFQHYRVQLNLLGDPHPAARQRHCKAQRPGAIAHRGGPQGFWLVLPCAWTLLGLTQFGGISCSMLCSTRWCARAVGARRGDADDGLYPTH